MCEGRKFEEKNMNAMCIAYLCPHKCVKVTTDRTGHYMPNAAAPV